MGFLKLTTGSTTYQYYFQPASKEGEIPGKLFYGGWTYVLNSKIRNVLSIVARGCHTWTDHETWSLCITCNVQEISVHAECQRLCYDEYNGEGAE